MTEDQHPTNQPEESTGKRPNTHFASPESLLDTTYCAIINIDATELSSPIVITNKMATTDPRSVGPEPAIFTDVEEANEQLARQETAFGAEHLRLVQFTIEKIFEEGTAEE